MDLIKRTHFSLDQEFNKLQLFKSNFLILILINFNTQIYSTSFSVTADGQTLTLDGDYYLGASSSAFGVYSSITITNSTGATRTATLNGAGYTIYFPYNTASSTFQFIGDGVVLTTQNVNFKCYNPAAVSYANANAKIIFGDNTKIVLDRDLSILYTDRTWTCSGNVVLDGQSLTLTASGESALSMQGLNKTLTIKNTILKPQGPDSICCLDGASKIVLSNSTLELGRDGMAVNNGNLDIDGKVIVRGVDISYTGTPSLAALTKRYQNLGFALWFVARASPAFYNISLSDSYPGNLGFTQVRITKRGGAYYSTSTNQYSVDWTEILPTGVYKSIDVGDDGQIWVIKTDQSVHRVTRGAPPTLSAASNVTGDYVTVGSANYVFVLNNSTGLVYQCNNPTGAVDSWSVVPGVYFPRSIAAGDDGTLWFVSTDGRVYKKSFTSDKIEQIFDGIDRDIVKISAAGSQDSNCIALLSSMPKDGRVLVSKSGGPFRDLGINKVVDVGIGINGSMAIAFHTSIVPEDGANDGADSFVKLNSYTSQILTMDRSLTFSSDKNLTIKSGAELELTNDAALRYQPKVPYSSYYDLRRHLVFSDYSSTLKMNRSILDCGQDGMTFSNGSLIFSGLNWIYTNTQTNCELEILSNANVSLNSDANINYMGPVDYSDTDLALQPPYYTVSGISEATMKSGATDSTTLQAITDGYAKGFKAPGSSSSHWRFSKIAILDTTATFTMPTTLVGYNTYSGPNWNLYAEKVSTPFSYFSIPVASTRSFDLGVDGSIGWYAGGWTFRSTGSIYNTPFNSSVLNTLDMNCLTLGLAINGGNFDSYSIRSNNLSAVLGSGTFGGFGLSTSISLNVTTMGETHFFKGISAGIDGTLWYASSSVGGSLYKRETSGTTNTIALPSNFSGSITSICAKGTTSTNYLGITSSTGQAFVKKDNGSWVDLALSGVVEIAVGVRGSIAVLIKADPSWTNNGQLVNGLLIKPGY